MGGDSLPEAVRLVDDRVKLRGGELGRVNRIGEREHAAGRHHLDHVGAIFHLRADGGAALVGAVADPFQHAGGLHPIDRKRITIRMAPGSPDAVDGGEDARPRDEPFRDRVAEPDVELVRGAEIADGREARVEELARVGGRVVRLLGRKAEQSLHLVPVVVAAALLGDVGMGVDEAREQRDVAEVHRLGVLRRRSCRCPPTTSTMMPFSTRILTPPSTSLSDFPSK